MNYATEEYVKARPETINEIPVLQFAFHSDGTRKDMIQLIQDRKNLIANQNYDIFIGAFYENIVCEA